MEIVIENSVVYLFFRSSINTYVLELYLNGFIRFSILFFLILGITLIRWLARALNYNQRSWFMPLAMHGALPENEHMPSVSSFAECQATGTRQSCGTRHAKILPSAGRRQ